jgi:hypothetical protein
MEICNFDAMNCIHDVTVLTLGHSSFEPSTKILKFVPTICTNIYSHQKLDYTTNNYIMQIQLQGHQYTSLYPRANSSVGGL